MTTIHNLAEVDAEGRLLSPAALAQIAEIAQAEAARVVPRQASPAELAALSVELPPGGSVIPSTVGSAWEFKNLRAEADRQQLTLTAGEFFQSQTYGAAKVMTSVDLRWQESITLQIAKPAAGYPAAGGGWIIAAGPMPEDEPAMVAYMAANDLMNMFYEMGLSPNMAETPDGIALVLQDNAGDPLSSGRATHSATLADVPALDTITRLPNPADLTGGGWGRVFEPLTPAQMTALMGG